jgi:hypothetical protein
MPFVALGAFLLYLLIAPAPAAAPDGYPAYDVLTAAASLLPLGDAAFRFQLACAACAAGAVYYTARVVHAVLPEDGAAIWGAVAAGALLAVSSVFVADATSAGIMAPTVLAIAVAAWFIVRVSAGGGAADGLGLAITCGLGLGLHQGFLWIVPVAFALLIVRLHRGARFPLGAPLLVAVVAGGLFAGLAVHGLTAGQLAEHLTRAQPARHSLEALGDSVGPFGAIAAAAGAIALWRRARTFWIAAALTAMIPTLGTPLVWAACVAAGVGVAALVRLTGRFAPVAGAGVAALTVVPAAALSLL